MHLDRLLLVLAASAGILGRTANAGVRVVDALGGTTYTTIQSAVTAAVDGDVILVRPTGTYAGFAIGDKELTIVGDGATAQVQVHGAVTITNVATTRTVVLANLHVTGPVNTATGAHAPAVYALGVAGSLRLQQCTLTGGEGTYGYDWGGYGYTTAGARALWIASCSGGVALEACVVQGGAGQFVNQGFPTIAYASGSDGGDGAYVVASRVALYDCTATGGHGGHSFDELVAGDGGAGLHAVSSTGAAQVTSSASSFTGGVGGNENFGAFGPFHPGDGGDGLWVGVGSFAWLLAPAFVGGAPGLYIGGPPDGQPGDPNRNDGTETAFQVSRVKMTAPPLVRAQTQSLTLVFAADPGDELYLSESDRTSYVGTVSWRGVQLARAAGVHPQLRVPVPIVVIPASGQASVILPPRTLAPGVLGTTRYLQVYRMTASGSITLGSFAALTVVDPSF
jgi:hypothetical protein